MRVVPQDLEVEIAPDQFRQPGFGPRAAARVRFARQPAYRYRAETQMHRQIARPLGGRKVAQHLVAVDAVAEAVEQRVGAAHAGRQLQRRQIGRPETHVGQRRDDARRHRRQRTRVATHRIGLQVKGRELLQPGVLVGREYRERLAALGQHLVALEDDLVLERVEGDAVARQRVVHRAVARKCGGFVVAVGDHAGHTQFARQLRDDVAGAAVAHDEPAAQRAQRSVQLGHRGVDEFDPAVGLQPFGQQFVQDVGVEHEHAPHRPAGAQRMVEGGVVVDAQVAAEPDQSGSGVVGHAGSP